MPGFLYTYQVSIYVAFCFEFLCVFVGIVDYCTFFLRYFPYHDLLLLSVEFFFVLEFYQADVPCNYQLIVKLIDTYFILCMRISVTYPSVLSL